MWSHRPSVVLARVLLVIGAVFKALSGTLIPAALIAGRRFRWTVVGVIATVVLVSVTLAPGYRLDHPTVVLGMLRGSSDHANNLAPAVAVDPAGLADPTVSTVRLASFIGVAASIISSVWLARSHSGLLAAALLGVIAMLLLPSALWHHHLVLLLPFAAMARASGSTSARSAPFVIAALVTPGLAWLPLALLAGAGLAVISLAVIRPRSATPSCTAHAARGTA